jgi:transcriptional regulator with XRE-family HTH domain
MANPLTEVDEDLDPEAVRIGATIRTIRQTSGITLAQLGGKVGKSHSYLSKVERGEKRAPRPLCLAIAHALGVPPVAIVSADYQNTEADVR